MIYSQWGRIIFFSSTGVTKGYPGTTSYSVTKKSLDGMQNVIVNEYSRFNVTANTIQLGYFDLGIYKKLSHETKNKLIKSIPTQKLGDINSLFNCINFIINSPFLNNATISLDGGIN